MTVYFTLGILFLWWGWFRRVWFVLPEDFSLFSSGSFESGGTRLSVRIMKTLSLWPETTGVICSLCHFMKQHMTNSCPLRLNIPCRIHSAILHSFKGNSKLHSGLVIGWNMNKQVLWQRCDWTLLNYYQSWRAPASHSGVCHSTRHTYHCSARYHRSGTSG